MYYCTIYQYPSGRVTDRTSLEVFISLSYQDKLDAENYKKNLIQQAIDNGGQVKTDEGDYISLVGKIIFKTAGIVANRGKNHYKIGIETETTKFSLLSLKAKAALPIYKTTDGLAYEVRVEELKQRKVEELKAKQDEATKNLKKFAAEIKPMTELYPVLRSFVRYSNQHTDKEKLAAVAIKKIQEISEL